MKDIDKIFEDWDEDEEIDYPESLIGKIFITNGVVIEIINCTSSRLFYTFPDNNYKSSMKLSSYEYLIKNGTYKLR